MKDYKFEHLDTEAKISRLIAIEEDRGYLLDSELKLYFELRYPNSKTKWKVYRQHSGRKK